MLLEDVGALIGLVFALFGVTMAVVTGDGRWDGVGALAIGSLLLVIAVFLALEMSRAAAGGERRARADGGDPRRAESEPPWRTDHPPATPCTLGRTSCWSRSRSRVEHDVRRELAAAIDAAERACARSSPRPGGSTSSPTSSVAGRPIRLGRCAAAARAGSRHRPADA